MRKLRWKVDQQLVRRNKRPLFHQNYFDKYEKEEFLIDADMEFYKVKKLLEKNPRLLRDDPVISIDYHKIITLIKQKKLVERTSNHFDPDNAYMTSWLDLKELDRVKNRKEQAALARHRRSLLEGDSGERAGFDYNSDDETTTTTIVDNKKQRLKQTRAIITQFDKLATNFQSGKKSTIGADATVTSRDGQEKAETAGMIKKRARDKKKKEKSLGAKLRLKTKKGGGDK